MKLQQKLLNREKTFATTISNLNWSGLVQIFNNETLDFLIFDFEHGRLTAESAEEMLRMCNVLKIPAIARVQEIAYAYMSTIFDMGADGILVPRIETLEQAKMVFNSIRFPPIGKKGCGGFSLFHDGRVSVEEFNQNRLVFLQIESALGIQNLEGMLALGKVDGVIVGPNDMSIAMGIPFQFDHPDLIAGIEEVIKICDKHKVSCGIYCDTPEEIHFWRSKGMNIFWSSGDLGFIKQAYGQLCKVIEELE